MERFLIDRRKVLDHMKRGIRDTPLYEYVPSDDLQGCRIFIKAEYNNPSRSHYDRVFLELFDRNVAKYSDRKCLVEVSSGNAAASVAWFCKCLHFDCRLFLPKPNEIPRGFVEHIQRQNPRARIINSHSESMYVAGAVNSLRRQLNKESGLWCINHSRQPATVAATRRIGEEVVAQLKQRNVRTLDYYIAACGNGSTVVGPAAALKDEYESVNVVAFETARAPVGFPVKYPNRTLERRDRHRLFGTGAYGVDFPFIKDAKYRFKDLVDDVILIEDDELDKAERLRFSIAPNVGMTSLVSLHLARRIIKDHGLRKKNFVLIFYDRGEKYDFVGNLTTDRHE